jgi:hypothetical protein
MKLCLTLPEISELAKEMDENSDGYITKEEFQYFLSKYDHSHRQTMILQPHQLLDLKLKMKKLRSPKTPTRKISAFSMGKSSVVKVNGALKVFSASGKRT